MTLSLAVRAIGAQLESAGFKAATLPPAVFDVWVTYGDGERYEMAIMREVGWAA